jgi:hypothetical protein
MLKFVQTHTHTTTSFVILGKPTCRERCARATSRLAQGAHGVSSVIARQGARHKGHGMLHSLDTVLSMSAIDCSMCGQTVQCVSLWSHSMPTRHACPLWAAAREQCDMVMDKYEEREDTDHDHIHRGHDKSEKGTELAAESVSRRVRHCVAQHLKIMRNTVSSSTGDRL